MHFRLAAAAALVLAAACSDTSLTIVCPGVAAPAVLVSVTDADGTRSLAAEARGWYAVGTRSDSLRYQASAAGDGLVALGPAGVYRVEVHLAGYAPWVAEGVRVSEGSCGVVTARVIAVPTPAPTAAAPAPRRG